LTWLVPFSAPDSLFYQSELNAGMFGSIQVLTETTTALPTAPPTTTTTAAPTTPPPPGTFDVVGMSFPLLPAEWSINGVAGNPAITVVRGRTYVFNVATPDMLFAIHTVGGSVSQANR